MKAFYNATIVCGINDLDGDPYVYPVYESVSESCNRGVMSSSMIAFWFKQ